MSARLASGQPILGEPEWHKAAQRWVLDGEQVGVAKGLPHCHQALMQLHETARPPANIAPTHWSRIIGHGSQLTGTLNAATIGNPAQDSETRCVHRGT